MQVVYAWAVTSVNTAWQVLLDNAKQIAQEHNVKPEELMFGMSMSPMHFAAQAVYRDLFTLLR